MNNSLIKSVLVASFAIIMATPAFAARGDNSEGNGGRNNNTPKDNCIQYKTRQVSYTEYVTVQEQRSRTIQVPETRYRPETQYRDETRLRDETRIRVDTLYRKEDRTRTVMVPVAFSNLHPAKMVCDKDDGNFADFTNPCTYSKAWIESGTKDEPEEQTYQVDVPYTVEVPYTVQVPYTVSVPFTAQIPYTVMADKIEYYTVPVTVAVAKTKDETYCVRYQTPDRGNSGNR